MARRLHVSRARCQSHFPAPGAGCIPAREVGYMFSRAWRLGYMFFVLGLGYMLSGRFDWPIA